MADMPCAFRHKLIRDVLSVTSRAALTSLIHSVWLITSFLDLVGQSAVVTRPILQAHHA
jgi:hypothetical protein